MKKQKNTLGKSLGRPLYCTLFAILLATLIVSCKKQSENISATNQAHKFQSKAEIKTYLNDKLDKYAKVLTSLSKSILVREAVNEGVAKKFDDDYNILIKDLYPLILEKLNRAKRAAGLKTMRLADQATETEPSSADLQTLKALIDEPIIINSATIYPHVYIPFFEERMEQKPKFTTSNSNTSYTVQKGKLSNVNAYDENGNAVIVPYNGDESVQQNTYPGYTYTNNGQLIENIPVNEEFAANHEVWVVTPNESVGNSGIMVAPPTTQNNLFPNNPSGTTTNIADIISQAAYVQNMVIKVNKESWIKGKSDICMTYTMSWANGINPITNTRAFHRFALSVWKYPSGGAPYPEWYSWVDFGKFTRKQIREKRSLNLNKYYAVWGSPRTAIPNSGEWNNMRNWHPERGDHLYYAIFEQDAWADKDYHVPLKSTHNSQGHTTIPLMVFSNNSPYITGVIRISSIPESNAIDSDCTNMLLAENDQIKFNALRNY